RNDSPRPCTRPPNTVASDRNRNRPASRLALGERHRGNRRREAQKRDIGGWITSSSFGSNDRAARRNDFKFVTRRQRLLGGDDNVGPPDDAGNVPLVRKTDGDNNRFCRFDASSQGV